MKQPQILKITRKAASLKQKQKQQSSPTTLDVTATTVASEPVVEVAAGDRHNAEGHQHWWSERWIGVLESFGWRRRLERARNYVREGRVLTLEFQGNQVHAQVQGTAPEPYHVKLHLDAFSEEQWQYAIDGMAQKAFYAAKLLAGEMPPSIEEVFTQAGLSLFPFTKFDIHSRCNCPDPVNPCKHIGAVYYLLGQYFNDDPFLLFQLRGKTKEEILQRLRHYRATATTPSMVPTPPPLYEPLKTDAPFCQYRQPLPPELVVLVPSGQPHAVLSVLPPFPHEVPSEVAQLMATLEQMYSSASLGACQLAMSEPLRGDEGTESEP
ncbi:metal-binding protein [Thermosynechococcus sp. QKsg1]|uniref:SWIM zinc finger family protein n=1 Tax=unclassified Thermosynechococcus TaxID=2622553 RepID=UPI00122E3ABA|nr:MULTISPECIES: metal-binding protein [unclassified Thermosynechococcus]QEQ00789.1 metal-binding protein [Thermosynechococcus sp. CL-1]WJI27563.1 metal-binding protein [Thermosynechococcus sp. B1]WKT84681.1 metal-binding protein [Thermosynechococcus sp. HY596]WNC63816.1 metal-binding protein [Thermosynechococcus sp. HY591]WNC66380.1 metal-binding protein [Thermosynechococcus sp. HY593]